MRTSWRLVTWRGVPVALDWTVLLALPWFYFLHRDLIDMALAFVAFFALMLVHELGHAAMAKWRKVPVIDIRLFIMHGYCRYAEPDHEADAIWIAWGGVAAQGLLLLLALGISGLLRAQSYYDIHRELLPMLWILIETNILIILLNLVPVPPLDGATAWRVIPLLWKGAPKPSLKRWLRNRKLQRQSNKIAADIIERVKKGQSPRSE